MTLIRELIGGYAAVIVVVLVSLGSALLIGWTSAPTISTTPPENLVMTDMQFETGYLTLSVNTKNGASTEITEVMIRNLSHPAVPEFKIVAYEFVPADEQVSFSISYDWASGDAYQIRLTSSRGYEFIEKAVAP